MNYIEAKAKLKEKSHLYAKVVDFIFDELLTDKSVKPELISKDNLITFRFSKTNNISFDLFFDLTDVRISFFLFEYKNNKVDKFYEVTDSYINSEIEAEDLNKYLIGLLSNSIKIVSVKNGKGDMLLKKYFEYISVISNNKRTSKGYIINKIIFPWQKTKIETKIFEPWINKS